MCVCIINFGDYHRCAALEKGRQGASGTDRERLTANGTKKPRASYNRDQYTKASRAPVAHDLPPSAFLWSYPPNNVAESESNMVQASPHVLDSDYGYDAVYPSQCCSHCKRSIGCCRRSQWSWPGSRKARAVSNRRSTVTICGVGA
ncbi:unnamed protein product [Echinostoma caproni]|uniref:Uncharacterized protein n=1 Tax=Echinostoma caproni TaxID=27848 RepID=A0A183BBQ7_9TREM|nr:unnamed protein product [Echinostoma caproni]